MEESPESNPGYVKTQIIAELQRMLAEGATDSEGSQVQEVIRKLDKEEISADEALAEVRRISESRQDYH